MKKYKKIFMFLACSIFSILMIGENKAYAEDVQPEVTKVICGTPRPVVTYDPMHPGRGNATEGNINCGYENRHLLLGNKMLLDGDVYLSDGSHAVGKQAELNWTVKRKDGSEARAVICEVECWEDGQETIVLYAPYGEEEDLVIQASSVLNPKILGTFSLKTVQQYKLVRAKKECTVLENENAGNREVKIGKSVEKWDPKTKTYTRILPDVTCGDPNYVFLGWGLQNSSGLYKPGETIKKSYTDHEKITTVWKMKQPFKKNSVRYFPENKGKSTDVVEVTKYEGKNKKIVIPNEITYKGMTYKVQTIGKNAFLKSNLQKVVLGKSIKMIETGAFAKNSRLKQIDIKTKVLSKIEKNAFQGLPKDAVITCPKGKLKSYSKLLKNAGLDAKIQVIESE